MQTINTQKLLSFLWGMVSGIIVVIFYLTTTLVFGSSAIRNPKMEHFHIRMQVEIDGAVQDFSSDKFQNLQDATICKGGLAGEPFHFHDKTDQIVHIHWQGVTGGQLLKYYGLNKIGEPEGKLGVRTDSLPKLAFVPIHGNSFSTPQNSDKLWIYTGDDHSHTTRSAQDFLQLAIDDFLGKKSEIRTNIESKSTSQSLINELFSGIEVAANTDNSTTTGSKLSTEDLEKLNDLLGNIVIFVQQNQPTEAQVNAKFQNLIPLSETVCGG